MTATATTTAATPTGTSTKRIEANRRNAQRSTGPKTAQGKSRVRLNALKHGLTAATVVIPGEDADLLDARVEDWKGDFRPRGAIEGYLVERAAHVSWQLDRADRTIAARLTDQINHHETDRTLEEAEEVLEYGRRLFWYRHGPIGLYPVFEDRGFPNRISTPTLDDPNDPARLILLLESTALGCRWLLDRWAELRKVLDDGRKWQPFDRLRAIRLLGLQPMNALDNERVMSIYLSCQAMDPTGPEVFRDIHSELEKHSERKTFQERAEARIGPYVAMSPESGRDNLLAIIDQAALRLEELLRIREERQSLEAPGRPDRLAFDDSQSGELLRRYQLAHGRALHRTFNSLFKVRKESERAGTDHTEALDDGDPPTPPGPPTAGDDEQTPLAPSPIDQQELIPAAAPDAGPCPGICPGGCVPGRAGGVSPLSSRAIAHRTGD